MVDMKAWVSVWLAFAGETADIDACSSSLVLGVETLDEWAN